MKNLFSFYSPFRSYFLLASLSYRSQFANWKVLREQIRFFRSARPLLYASPAPKNGQKILPADEDIPARLIQIVQDDKSLAPPTFLHEALNGFDRNKSLLLQVSPETPTRPAICKIMLKIELKEREKAKAKAAKQASGSSVKQIELNWGIDGHDLEHRLKKVREFLEKGKPVEFILLPKKKKKRATMEQAQSLVHTIKSRLPELGGTEVKPMAGTLLGVLHMFVQKKSDS